MLREIKLEIRLWYRLSYRGVGGIDEAAATKETGRTGKTGFADALKASLD